MVIDSKFIENFQYQIDALTRMKESIEAAIERGTKMRKQMKTGDPIEKFFPKKEATTSKG
jgi:hypothetical protein